MKRATKKTKKKAERVSLTELAERYFRERDVGSIYKNQIQMVIRRLREWHGGIVHVDDLTDDFANRFLMDRQEKVGKITVSNTRRMLLTLWRYAWDVELIEDLPRRVRKIKNTLAIPVALSPEEVRQLIKAAEGYKGWNFTAGCDAALFWKALFMTAWDTGLRRVDLRRINREQIGIDGAFMLVQNKTNWPVRCKIRPETLEAIDMTNPRNREFIFHGNTARWCASIATIFKIAGIKGSLKTIRKSSATAVEQLQPGAAMAHLGHKTPGLAARFYIDPMKIQSTKIQAPSLYPELDSAQLLLPAPERPQNEPPKPVYVELVVEKPRNAHPAMDAGEWLQHLRLKDRLTGHEVKLALAAARVPPAMFAAWLGMDVPSFLESLNKQHCYLTPDIERRVREAMGIGKDSKAKGGAA